MKVSLNSTASSIFMWIIVLLYGDFIKSETSEKCSFKAAVHEHLSFTSLVANVTKGEATRIMQLNLNVYEQQVVQAVAQEAKIIVFPEYGITGFFMGDRESIQPYLQYIPDISKRPINPCAEGGYQLIPSMLSCLAREHSIIIVANFATYQPCNEETDPSCPSDGQYQYNTAVAFGEDGAILAKYNKINLYSGEKQILDAGEDSKYNLGFFKTEFGVFGLFICFDVLFYAPAATYMQIGVDTMLFPTGWMNELPLLSCIEYQQAFALGHKVNILGANQHLPFENMTGSGIFSGVDGSGSYYHNDRSYSGKLVVSELPCYPKDHISNEANQTPKIVGKESESKPNLSKNEYLKVGTVHADYHQDFQQGRNSKDLKLREGKLLNLVSKDDRQNSVHDNETFISRMNDDPTTFKLLLNSQDKVSVSDGNITCTLKYSMSQSVPLDEWYALGAFSGLHVRNRQYFVQTCALIKCKDKVKSECGAQVHMSKTTFDWFDLKISGYDQHVFLTPEIVTSGINLLPKGVKWDSNSAIDHIWSAKGVGEPLIIAGIYGRLYNRD